MLDLDETLIHCSDEVEDEKGQTVSVAFNKRPHVTAFLKEMSKHYDIVIFTAAEQSVSEIEVIF